MQSQTDSDTIYAIAEFQTASLRAVIMVTGIVSLLVLLYTFAIDPPRVLGIDGLILLLVVGVNSLALGFINKDVQSYAVIWTVGSAVILGVWIATYQQALAGILYGFLILVMCVLFGWQVGLISLILISGVTLFLALILPILPVLFELTTPIIMNVLFCFGLGVIFQHYFVDILSSYYQNYIKARDDLEEAREQRLEFRQIQDDLLHSNQELVRLKDRYKALQVLADEARQAKQTFVANVSHELRTPLNMIIGFSEMITQNPKVYNTKLPPALLADIRTIQRNSTHLARLVDDVLDLSQVDAGRMAISKEKTSVAEIIDFAVNSVRLLFESKKLYLEVDISSNLPSIFCDKTRIRQVLINLLSNAGRFTEKGGVRVRVWRELNRILFCVADTGPGIAAKDQERLFTPFEQVDSSIRRRHGGSGLGLSISKRFIEMHDGEIWLESTLGVGTMIYFSLPLEEASSITNVISGAQRWVTPFTQVDWRNRPSKAPIPNPKPRFVLLEAGDNLRKLLARYWEDVEVQPVHDMITAQQELSKSPAQAFIVNSSEFLSPQGLLDILQYLSDLPYDTPVITFWVPGKDEAAQQLGVVDYLIKPVTANQLLESLAKIDEGVKTILLVDDEPDLLRLFTRVLINAGQKYRVLRATNGQDALELLRTRQPDVMVLDLVMPGKDGFQVLLEKKNDPAIQNIPVVVISSLDPLKEAILVNTIMVNRKNGLTIRELLVFIQQTSLLLTPSESLHDQELPENRRG